MPGESLTLNDATHSQKQSREEGTEPTEPAPLHPVPASCVAFGWQEIALPGCRPRKGQITT